MGLVPPKFMPPYGALLRCGECHDLITSHDVSCPHCGKRFTRRSPLKFGGYSSRDMLPEKVEHDQAIKLREMIEQTTRNPGTATIRVMKRIEQDIAMREQELPTGSNVIGTALPPSPPSFRLTGNTIGWKYPTVADEDWRKLIVREP